MRTVIYKNHRLQISPVGDIYHFNGGLVDRSWNGLYNDYLIYLKENNEKFATPTKSKDVIRFAHSRNKK